MSQRPADTRPPGPDFDRLAEIEATRADKFAQLVRSWEGMSPSDRAEALLRYMEGMAEACGLDVTVCEFCGDDLDEEGDGRPWRRGLDGSGAHEECIEDQGLNA